MVAYSLHTAATHAAWERDMNAWPNYSLRETELPPAGTVVAEFTSGFDALHFSKAKGPRYTVTPGINHTFAVRVVESAAEHVGADSSPTPLIPSEAVGGFLTRSTDVEQLQVALELLTRHVETTLSDSEGYWPHPDAGCIDCTYGTVPDSRNTGRCPFHHAKFLLRLE